MRSKTVLWNLCVAAAGIWSSIDGYTVNLRDTLGPHWFGIVSFAVGMVGIVLRLMTKQPLTSRETP